MSKMVSFALLLALETATAQAQMPAAPQPSAPALALARSIKASAVSSANSTLEQTAAALSRNLLHTTFVPRGPGCEPTLAECQAAADRIAREAAPELLAERREVGAKMTALALDEEMTPDQLHATQTFIDTPAGKAFARGLGLSSNPMAASPAFQQKLGLVLMQPSNFRETRLAERFYDETKSLPRAHLVAPPPPVAPPRLPK